MNNRDYASWKGQEYSFSITTRLPPQPFQQYKKEFLCSKHHSNNICILQSVFGDVIFFCVYMEAIGVSL